MCGIAGRLNTNGSANDRASSAKMIRLMKHRGPDNQNLLFIDTNTVTSKRFSGFEIERGNFGDLFLGHARLSIIDLDTGDQPMTDLSGKLSIVFNGEIYNYLEVKESLVKLGYQFKTKSDTEVILNSYKAYGTNCVKYFNGMFAFAIYDAVQNSLFCARDRLGIKPFYYYQDNQKFIFASEIKAILAHNDINREIDYEGMADYLTFQYTLDNKTFFRKIKSLPAGFTMTLGKNGLLFNRYWSPSLEPDENITEQSAVGELAALLDDAIGIHMRSDVQIGAYLSGGIDSSIISGILSKKYDKALFTFTGRFNEGNLYDESRFAFEMAKNIDSKIFVITPTADDLMAQFKKLAWHLDFPVIGPGAFSQFMVSKIAGNRLKVVMGGQGGDELFLGYPRYIRSVIENKLLFGKPDKLVADANGLYLALKYFAQYGVPGLAGWALKRRLADFDRRYVLTSAPLYGLKNCFSGPLADTVKHYSPIDNALYSFKNINSSSLINRMSWYDINNYLAGLLQIEDRVSMAWSLESRVPLLDYRIVELCLKIPSKIKLKNLEPKHILKKAGESVLPPSIKNRKDKKGFPTPTDVWFNGALSNYAGSFVTPDRLKQRNLYNSNRLTEFFASNRRYFTPAIKRELLLWVFINIELWHQLFIDGDNSLDEITSTNSVKANLFV